MSKFKRIALITVMALMFAGPALAQGEPPPTEPIPPVLEVPTVDELLTAVEVTLTAILAGVIASPVTSAAVGIVKWAGERFNIALIKAASGSQLNTVMVFILVGAVWIARFFGVADSLNSAFAIILALAPILAGVAAGARASSGVYGNVTRGKVALVGYERASERKARTSFTDSRAGNNAA